MATPNVDRLHGIEPWDPRINETTNEEILKIRDDLNLVADLTGRPPPTWACAAAPPKRPKPN